MINYAEYDKTVSWRHKKDLLKAAKSLRLHYISEAIHKLYKKELSTLKVAEVFPLSRSRIRTHLSKMGVKLMPKGRIVGVKTLKVQVECKCPKCGKRHTREHSVEYIGPAKYMPEFCQICKIVANGYADESEQRAGI